jgi:hypothetical protein
MPASSNEMELLITLSYITVQCCPTADTEQAQLKSFTDEAQTTLFKDPVHTAQ